MRGGMVMSILHLGSVVAVYCGACTYDIRPALSIALLAWRLSDHAYSSTHPHSLEIVRVTRFAFIPENVRASRASQRGGRGSHKPACLRRYS
jgi:hypothetical protein